MNGIAPLPADISAWGHDRVDAELNSRRVVLQQVFAEAGRSNDMSKVKTLDGSSAAKVEQIQELNADMGRLADASANLSKVDRPGIFRPSSPQRAGEFLPEGGYGRVGKAFLERLQLQSGLRGTVDGVEMMASALDGTSGGTVTPQFFDYNINELPQRALFIRSLIPTVQVNTDKVEYIQQSVATQNAAPTSVNALKPTSIYTVQRIEATVRVIAHVSEALDRSILADFQQLPQFIDGQLTLGVLLAEENQILNGDGTGANLTGILNTSGTQTQARGADPQFDAFLKAFTKLRTVFIEPDGIVMHPTDYQSIRLLRTADGLYLFGDPAQRGPDTLWGKQVVQSTLITQGTALVGNFALGATVYQREGAFVSFAETGLGDSAGQELFTRNQVRFRGESRLTLGVPRPSAFCKVTGL